MKDDRRRSVGATLGVVAAVAAALAAVVSGHPGWLTFCVVLAVVALLLAVAFVVPDLTGLLEGRVRSFRAVQSPSARRTAVTTDRWRYTAWGTHAPAAMNLLDLWIPGANHNQHPGENLAWVRFIAVVACSPIGPDISGKQLWPWLEEFLGQALVTDLVAALTSPSEGLSWTRWASSHASTVNAMLTSGGEDEAVASARLDVPDGLARRIEPGSAILTLNFEPPRNGGKPPTALTSAMWDDLIRQAMEIPLALTEYLSHKLGLTISGEPPVQLGVRLEAESDLTELIDTTGLESLPGGRRRSQAIGYFVGADDGSAPADAAKQMVTDVLRYGLNIER